MVLRACQQSQQSSNIPQILPNIPSAPCFPDLVLDSPAGPPRCEVCLWPGLEKDCLYFLHSLTFAKLLFHRLLSEDTDLLSQVRSLSHSKQLRPGSHKETLSPTSSACSLTTHAQTCFYVSATHTCFWLTFRKETCKCISKSLLIIF